jgi:hypothetical protein
MANDTTVTIPLDEYIDLRRRADENLYLSTQLGSFENKLWNLENKVFELEGMVRNGK